LYYLLFTFYLVIACFFITRIRFIKNTQIPINQILLLFILKISAGLFIGWMSQKFYPQGNDYWGLNSAGWGDYQLLLKNPRHFLDDLFISIYKNGYHGFFNSTGSYWNDLKNTLIIKLLACCNFFSGGNYYINSLFFNFIGFFGHVALYKIFIHIYNDKKWPVIIGCFLLPSTLYFTSGIHKDLFVFTLLGIFCYSLYFIVHSKIKNSYLLALCVSFTGLVLIRNFVALAIIPAGIAFICCNKIRSHKLLIFFSTYASLLLMFFLLHLIKPSFQPLKIITNKQQDFIDLPYAASQLDLPVLEPSLKSLIKNSPVAIDHSMLRPYIWEYPTTFLIPLAIELFIYELLFMVMLIWYQKAGRSLNDFVLFGLFLSLSLLIFTGFIVPNIGSIVRYRSIYLPFLLTPVICHISWKKIHITYI